MPTKPLEDLEAMVGESKQTVEGLRVAPGKVAEFARAVRDDNPAHYDPDAARERGFDAVPAPLTFTRVSAFPHNRPEGVEGTGFDLGLEPVIIHGEQAYEFERPLVAGDVLDGETTLADVYQREGGRGGTMTFVEYETAYYDQGGDLVVTDRSTAIETEESVGGDDGDGDAGGDGGTGDGRASAKTAATDGEQIEREDRTRYLDPEEGTTMTGEPVRTAGEVAVGDAGPELTVEDVQRPDFVKYAGASGDFNPVHYSEPYAHATGSRSVFGQGMLTAGYAAHFVADWFGLANVSNFRVRFEEQLWPGDTVTASGEVTAVDEGSEGATVEADIAVTNEAGTRLVSGDCAARLPPE
ncbi:FAS1-like dehydratase domain-containing protein [Salinirussus salinus]|jgi:acyl dehydratase|uniref:FAS1-like dehydratase domain-containing protein n=1 Tax=Salinirussus salinus TaxID=1198300 RepID=UPI001359AB88|nr:MaoC family dehydratase N-terminal domain-containing protein [Salinirussus salinus]